MEPHKFTDAEVLAWYNAAINDGWSVDDNSGMGNVTDLVNSFIVLRKDDWAAHCGQRMIRVWGPDRLQIVVPAIYNMDALQNALRQCENCGATDVDTVRYSFAGRCCQNCLPEMRRIHEFAGWYN